MGIPFNDESDKWVTEICKAMGEKDMHFGEAVDYLTALKKAALPAPPKPLVVAPPTPPKFTPDQRVVCPHCKAAMPYRDWPMHRMSHA
jgi:hypothetical protein